MSQQRRARRQAEEQELTELLRSLVTNCRDPARLVELYYWSVEPELAEVMRHYIALPRDVSTKLHAFLMLAAQDPGSVHLRFSGNGEMILSSPLASEVARRLSTPDESPPAVH
jgi:hypothetical protein